MAINNTGNISYTPTVPPTRGDYDDTQSRDLMKWIDQEHRKIASAISGLGYQYQEMHQPPERFGIGYIAYADGTNWNPASGEGLYVYKSTGWTLLG